jgi:hypothetical protein
VQKNYHQKIIFLHIQLEDLSQTTKAIYGKSFKNINRMDSKLIAFEVKKEFLLHPAKQGSTNLEFFWLKTFVLTKFKVFDIP